MTSRSTRVMPSRLWLITGLSFGVLTVSFYGLVGYDWTLPLFWLASISLTGASLWPRRVRATAPTGETFLGEWQAVFVLVCAFAPLYLTQLYTVPFQINTDELTLMIVESRLTAQHTSDLLGLSNYSRLPSLIFVVFGWAGKWLGGITLLHMRAVHALCGVLIIAATYRFLRLLFSQGQAMAGAILMGSQHTLFMLSRMAMRDNTALLLELLALIYLVKGLQRGCRFASFVGGAIAGLGWYTYYPSRITIILWSVFFAALVLLPKRGQPRATPAKLFAITMLGFALAAAPVLIATVKGYPESLKQSREQLLITPEGLAKQQWWVRAGTANEAFQHNVLDGLTLFNNYLSDRGNIYINEGHGFVDPLTGVLIWIGLLCLGMRLRAPSSRRDGALLVVTGFLSLWLALSFLVNKSPNYTRSLVTLPFVVVLVVEAATCLAGLLAIAARRLSRHRALELAIFGGIITVIVLWNVAIAADFVRRGLAQGNDVGAMVRYVEAQRNLPHHRFYLCQTSSREFPRLRDPRWRDWLGYVAGPDHTVQLIVSERGELAVEDVLAALAEPPFTVFMTQQLWARCYSALQAHYADMKSYNLYPRRSSLQPVTPTGRLVAVEVR